MHFYLDKSYQDPFTRLRSTNANQSKLTVPFLIFHTEHSRSESSKWAAEKFLRDDERDFA